MAKTAIPVAPSLGVLLGRQPVDKAWFLANSELVMTSMGSATSADEFARGANLLASAAALGVNIQKIFAWADGVYKRAHAHYTKEAALSKRTDAILEKANARYGKRPMFFKRTNALRTLSEGLHASLAKKSRERAIAAYVMGVAYVRMGALHNAVRVGFARACNHAEVSKWVERTARELHKTGADALLQVAMANGLFQNSKPGQPDEKVAQGLINGYEGLLRAANMRGDGYDSMATV
jgi:hypothetical protein